MPDGVSVKVLNKDRLIARFRKLVPVAREEVTDAALKGAEAVASLARHLVHSKRVAATIQVERIPDRLAARVVAGDVTTLVEVRAGSGEYVNIARLEHNGTAPHILGGLYEGAHHPGTKGNPFLTGASNLEEKTNKRRMGTAIGKAARRVAGKV